MWSLIPQKGMMPTRLARYCCAVLKEQAGKESFIATGVRWDESRKRETRKMFETIQRETGKRLYLNNDNDESRMLFETCQLKAKRVVNPIIDWTDKDVWDFIDSEDIPVNPLYGDGFCRIGCIGCPMAGTKGRYEQFSRYPKYKDLYMMAIKNMLDKQKAEGKTPPITDPEELFHWWMEDGVIPGQMDMFDDDDETT